MSFASLGLPESIVRSVRAVGYSEPTPIQLKAIPLILPGRDLVAAAQTGSGKTAAFLLPILVRLMEGPRHLRALILVPTRELAAQVEQAGKKYARYSGVRVGCVYGGVPIGPQERMLRHEGVELLVATPGRLLDLQGRQSVSLDDVEVLVLDEADRMVDMGFAPDLRRIIRLLPEKRQTLMFSATMPTELNKVAAEALHRPQRLEVSPPSKPVATVAQAFYPVPRHLKASLLDELLHELEHGSTIVFTRTKRGADRLSRILKDRGHDADVLHGDRTQGQRERTMLNFRRGRVQILVATDIASRGIDVSDITHVINYDVPLAPEDYMHRIGRTARMHAKGDALTFVSPEEEKDAAAIERFIGKRVDRVTSANFDYTKRATSTPGREHGGDRKRGSGRERGGRTDGTTSGKRAHGTTVSRGDGASHSGHGSSHSKPAPAPSHGRKPRSGGSDRRSRKRM